MPQAILFDLDETLTDRMPSIVRYAERFQRDFMVSLAPTEVSSIVAALLAADVRGYHPRTEVVRDFAQRLSWRTVPNISGLRIHWDTCFPRSVVARTGLDATLSALHTQGIRLGIVTNGEVQFQQPKIEQLAITPYLSTVVISEAVQVQKPDPRIFAHALAKIGCRVSHTWFVGDHPVNDVLGAAAVGLPGRFGSPGCAPGRQSILQPSGRLPLSGTLSRSCQRN